MSNVLSDTMRANLKELSPSVRKTLYKAFDDPSPNQSTTGTTGKTISNDYSAPAGGNYICSFRGGSDLTGFTGGFTGIGYSGFK